MSPDSKDSCSRPRTIARCLNVGAWRLQPACVARRLSDARRHSDARSPETRRSVRIKFEVRFLNLCSLEFLSAVGRPRRRLTPPAYPARFEPDGVLGNWLPTAPPTPPRPDGSGSSCRFTRQRMRHLLRRLGQRSAAARLRAERIPICGGHASCRRTVGARSIGTSPPAPEAERVGRYVGDRTAVLATPELARTTRPWLEVNPGTRCPGVGSGLGWEETTWLAGRRARRALGLALSGTAADGVVTLARAKGRDRERRASGERVKPVRPEIGRGLRSSHLSAISRQLGL